MTTLRRAPTPNQAGPSQETNTGPTTTTTTNARISIV
jgi:hypothetical protein